MIARLGAALAILLALGTAVSAHRIDEYLQAALISVEKDRIQVSMRLVPGVAVFPVVFASIDTNSDGVIAEIEQRAYAESVLADLSLSIDNHRLNLQLASVDFPATDAMTKGLGEIRIEFSAVVPAGSSNRKLLFENHHQSQLSAYLVNCLVPQSRDIQIIAENRNENQSSYQLTYLQAGSAPNEPDTMWWPGTRAAFSNLGSFPSMFRLGVQHIAEGTDHLLFLLTLLLPAALLAIGSRWAGPAGLRQSLSRIVKVVTAFTAGHSITLALAGFGLVSVPTHPVEVLIAASILVSALHAFRPIFPGRESAIAAFFGLIHGLAFAATLGQLGLDPWQRVASLLGFNLGIEAMQLVVVAAIMPSLLLLSRTGAYPVLRNGGAVFAGLASAGWITERQWGLLPNAVDIVVDTVAHQAVWIAALLFLASLSCWLLPIWQRQGVVDAGCSRIRSGPLPSREVTPPPARP